MKAIPETLAAIDELDPTLSDDDLLEQLTRSGERVRAVAPDVIGMSVAMFEHGVTLTLMASDEDIATLDAFQYLNGGPCAEAKDPASGVETTLEDLFSETRWRLFAQASAANAVRSTLTLPIVRRDQVIGTVNLYGASERTFGGHHAELAEILGGWAAGAVANADLSFSTRRQAQAAPEILRASAVMESAVGVLASTLDIGFREARNRLQRAAEQAGVSPGRLAAAVLALQFDS